MGRSQLFDLENMGPLRVLVIVSNRENYYESLGQKTVLGYTIEVDQAPWADIVGLVSFPDSLVAHIRPQKSPLPNSPQDRARSFAPHLVLLRSFVLGNPDHDWRHLFKALAHQHVRVINSLSSFLFSVEKEIMWGQLRRIQKEKCPTLPLIPQTYYSSAAVAGFADFPLVLKVGSASQGVGKAVVSSSTAWKDYCSVLEMLPKSGLGFTAEPMIEWESDLRLQKIGAHYRAIRRFKSGNSDAWKANDALGIQEEDVTMELRWKHWLDVLSCELDMPILGMDLLVSSDGREYLLELNSSSIGFPPRHREEDCTHICEVVLAQAAEVAKDRIRNVMHVQLMKAVEGYVAKKMSTESMHRIWMEDDAAKWLKLFDLPKAIRGGDEGILAAKLVQIWCAAIAGVVDSADARFFVGSIAAQCASKILEKEDASDENDVHNTIQLALEMGLVRKK